MKHLLVLFITLYLSQPALSCKNGTACSEEDALKDLPVAKLAPDVFAKYQSDIVKQFDDSEVQFWDSERTKRKTVEYGYGFQRMVNNDFSFKKPPQFLVDLGDAVCDALNEPRQSFNNYIISLYEPEFQIEPHYDTDKAHLDKYGFYYAEKVFGVVIQPDPTGSLYFARYEGDDPHPPLDIKPRFKVHEEEGTTFVLKGKYRYKPFYHGVSEISQQRISVTFRVAKME